MPRSAALRASSAGASASSRPRGPARPSPAQPSHGKTTRRGERERLLILVAEDSVDTREMYLEYLAHVGFDTATAVNGQEVLDKARALGPDAIVMDLRMPGIDGLQATRALRADPRTHLIPVIACTGRAFEEEQLIARDAGCDRVLVKPCMPEDVVAALRALQIYAPGDPR